MTLPVNDQKLPVSEIVEKVHDMFIFKQGRLLRVSKTAKDIGISDEKAFHIFTVKLGIKEFSTR